MTAAVASSIAGHGGASTAPRPAAIGVRGLRVSLDGCPVLHGVTLLPLPGQVTALCGPNGAGKTTLLRALAGLVPGTSRPDPRRVAYMEQGARSAWGMTVAEVAALGRIPHGDRDAAAVDRALRACRLDLLRDRRVDRISGGQARRAMLARALATEPDALLLDEPTGDLDPAAAHEVMALLLRQARAGCCVIVVLHALDLALRYADRMVVLQAGRITADAAPGDALPAAAAAFGLPWGVDPAPRLLPPVRDAVGP